MIDIADNEARHIGLLYRRMLRELDRELAPLGLGPGRYVYLFALYIEDGRSQQALADAVGADKAAAARAILRLEADGLVRRVPCPRDRRVQKVFLTAPGRRLRSTLEKAATSTIAVLTGPLDAAERAQLRRLLHLLCAVPASR